MSIKSVDVWELPKSEPEDGLDLMKDIYKPREPISPTFDFFPFLSRMSSRERELAEQLVVNMEVAR